MSNPYQPPEKESNTPQSRRKLILFLTAVIVCLGVLVGYQTLRIAQLQEIAARERLRALIQQKNAQQAADEAHELLEKTKVEGAPTVPGKL